MGGLWEVSGKHLPSSFPFIYRPFTPLTGGWEVYDVNDNVKKEGEMQHVS